ncbi:MAG TPA: efflux RND transporter periplasmic adaptor subunit [Armatimonadota bacterium]
MRSVRTLSAALAALLTLGPAFAGPQARVGPYTIEVATDPAVIAVGDARLLIRVTDASGKPVDGATVSALVKMPAMDMGEVERPASPVAGTPGVYEAKAAFAMAGDFEATVKVAGPNGAATGKIPLKTGQDTGALSATQAAGGSAPSGPSPARFLPWLLLVAGAAFIVHRMRKTGQHMNWKAVLHWQFLVGIAILIVLFLIASYAVGHWRRPGSMTPLEAQGMEMNTPAPPGTAPVQLASVTRGPIDSTVTYTGQAAGFYEQDVVARVRGVIVDMPCYIGDHVVKGQVVGRLDTSEIDPKIAENLAMADSAQQGIVAARAEYRQALAAVAQARSESTGKQNGVLDSRANLTAAQQEKAGAQAALSSAQSQLSDAQAQLDSATADNLYWQAQVGRTRSLEKAGAVSGEELQKDVASAQDAASKVRQAQALIAKVKADIRVAQAASRKADAMILSARAKIAQSGDETDASRAQIRTMQAAADAAKQRIAQAESALLQAEAVVTQSSTQRDFAVLRSGINGIVSRHGPNIGQLMSPGQVIQTIVQVDPIRLQANVAESDLAKIRVGSPITITSATRLRTPVRARVTSITPSLDPTSRTGVVEAVLPNPDGRFAPGQYVVMSISVGRNASSLRVPTAAVHWRTPATGDAVSTQGTPYVWVAAPASGGRYTARMVDVVVGLTGGTTTEITSGLNEGQKVVTVGADTLSDGDTVAPAGSSAATSGPSSPSSPAAGSMPGMKM